MMKILTQMQQILLETLVKPFLNTVREEDIGRDQEMLPAEVQGRKAGPYALPKAREIKIGVAEIQS